MKAYIKSQSPEGRGFEMNTYTSNSTLCCHWCKIPLGNASQVTYLNGNLPICDLCLSKDKRIAELEAQVEKLKKAIAIRDRIME